MNDPRPHTAEAGRQRPGAVEHVLQYRESLSIALDSLTRHKTRSVLTMLGIVFGVGAVIAMLSIGEGARLEALEQIEALGVRNIIIRSQQVEEDAGEETSRTRPMGITTRDADAIRAICSFAERVAVSREHALDARSYEGKARTTVIGVTPEYATLFNARISEGHFIHRHHIERHANVCVIGSDVRQALFGFRSPVGERVKVGTLWFTVVGVLSPKRAVSSPDLDLVSSNAVMLIPLTTAMAKLPREENVEGGRRGRMRFRQSSSEQTDTDRSTIDQIAVRVDPSLPIDEAARVITRILRSRHNGQEDFTVTIPEALLEQQQKTQGIFNIVMGAIAGISLLVGGIGIMNIMLASVLERTREIGIRRAIGATRGMVVVQFLAEAVFLSIAGGLVGIGVGWGLTEVITAYAGWRTIVSPWSIILAFTVSAATGILFGYYPARRASEADVIESLRYE